MKRNAAVLLLCLILGAMLNVLVAWACWCSPRWRLNQEAPLTTRRWPSWAGADWPDAATTRTSWNTYVTLTRTRPAERVPRQFASDAPATIYAQWGAGLPLRSMGVSYTMDYRPVSGPPVEESRGEWALPPWLVQRLGGRQTLPARPLPVGFAVNSLLYGALLWLPVSGLWTLRRRRRRRLGLCERCAYPAGISDACTECGATLPPVDPREARLMKQLCTVSVIAAAGFLLAACCAPRPNDDRSTPEPPPAAAQPTGADPVNVPPQPSPGVQGTYIGTLRGGMVAIGGESTGWVLQGAGDGRGSGMDLDVTRVQGRAQELEGQSVIVRGHVEERRYVERGTVKVLIAESINP